MENPNRPYVTREQVERTWATAWYWINQSAYYAGIGAWWTYDRMVDAGSWLVARATDGYDAPEHNSTAKSRKARPLPIPSEIHPSLTPPEVWHPGETGFRPTAQAPRNSPKAPDEQWYLERGIPLPSAPPPSPTKL